MSTLPVEELAAAIELLYNAVSRAHNEGIIDLQASGLGVRSVPVVSYIVFRSAVERFEELAKSCVAAESWPVVEAMVRATRKSERLPNNVIPMVRA